MEIMLPVCVNPYAFPLSHQHLYLWERDCSMNSTINLTDNQIGMSSGWDGTVDKNFGWVILIVILTWFLNFFQMLMIIFRRLMDKVSPPIMYVEDKPKFNGAQRAHQHTLEQVPFFLAVLLLAGIRHPAEATGLGGAWLLSRLLYSAGYYTGVPKYRFPGLALTLTVQMILVGFAASTAAGYLDWW